MQGFTSAKCIKENSHCFKFANPSLARFITWRFKFRNSSSNGLAIMGSLLMIWNRKFKCLWRRKLKTWFMILNPTGPGTGMPVAATAQSDSEPSGWVRAWVVSESVRVRVRVTVSNSACWQNLNSDFKMACQCDTATHWPLPARLLARHGPSAKSGLAVPVSPSAWGGAERAGPNPDPALSWYGPARTGPSGLSALQVWLPDRCPRNAYTQALRYHWQDSKTRMAQMDKRKMQLPLQRSFDHSSTVTPSHRWSRKSGGGRWGHFFFFFFCSQWLDNLRRKLLKSVQSKFILAQNLKFWVLTLFAMFPEASPIDRQY